MSKKPKQKLSSVFKNNLYMLGIIARYIPSYFILRMLHGVLYGVMDFVSTYFSYRLLNQVSDGGSFTKAAIIIGLMALFNFAFHLFDIWFRELHDPTQKQKLHLRMHKELFEKSLNTIKLSLKTKLPI